VARPGAPGSPTTVGQFFGSIERLDPRFDRLVPADSRLETIADGFIWTEGSVWWRAGNALLFSDIPNNVVHRWQEGRGVAEYLKPSGYTGERPRGGRAGDEPGSNGLAFDAEGRLVLAQHGDRRVARQEKDGRMTVLADRFEGKRLNSPNDVTIHPNGDIYFTDPRFGMASWDQRELDFTGVYRISARDGSVHLVSRALSPNGIALSPDARTLYVTSGRTWMAFPVAADGTTGEPRVFADARQWTLASAAGGGLDGLEVDAAGNLFATGPGGVCVIAPDGTLLGRILTGDRTANLGFGGPDGRTLYICVNHRIARIRLTTQGLGW
jgi:gluconolactonase